MELCLWNLIRNALWNTNQVEASLVNWEEVWNLSHRHGVEIMLSTVISKLSVADEVKAQWERDAFIRAARDFRVIRLQNTIADILDKNGIVWAILKGTAARIYYPNPRYCAMGDIDIIVRPDSFSDALHLLIAHGFQEIKGMNQRHTSLVKNGIEVEIHRYYSLTDGESVIDHLITEQLGECQSIGCEDYSFRILPPVCNGLILLDHIAHHIADGMGVRQLLDFIMFVQWGLDDQMWETGFEQYAVQMNLTFLAKVVARCGQLYFDMPYRYQWIDDVDDQVCEELMEYVLTQGSNVNNDEVCIETWVKSMFRCRNGLFPALQRLGEAKCPWIKRMPWVKTIAWLYGAAVMMKRLLKLKHPLRCLRYAKKLYQFRIGLAQNLKMADYEWR